MSVSNFVKAVLSKNVILNQSWPFPDQKSMNFSSKVPVNLSKINITHCISHTGKGGVTFAWRKTSEMRNCRMVEVAVAYCSPADVFTKKIGTASALQNFEAGMTVLVPARTHNDDLSIPINLRNMFWYSLDI